MRITVLAFLALLLCSCGAHQQVTGELLTNGTSANLYANHAITVGYGINW
jgi:hypothetical protein